MAFEVGYMLASRLGFMVRRYFGCPARGLDESDHHVLKECQHDSSVTECTD